MAKKKTPSERVLELLLKPNARYKFKHLVALSKLTTDEVSRAIAELRKTYPNLVFSKFDKTFYFADTPTWYSNQTDLSQEMPLEGCFGLLSDTHLCSIAERMDILNTAYDLFAERGIKQVFHCGD